MPRYTPRLAMVGLVLVLAGAAGWAASGRPEPEPPASEPSMKGTYAVVIPRANYQSLVISPRDDGGTHGGAQPAPVPFVLRTRDSNGVVSDFPFFVRVGDLHTIAFPTGWMPATAAALFAPNGAIFAAWGVTAGAPGVGGSTVRFEPIDRDPNRDTRNRERERDFEEFLREAQRNK